MQVNNHDISWQILLFYKLDLENYLTTFTRIDSDGFRGENLQPAHMSGPVRSDSGGGGCDVSKWAGFHRMAHKINSFKNNGKADIVK